MRPDRCLRAGPGTDLDALVRAGRLHPGDAVEIGRFLAYLRTVTALSAAGASRDAAKAAAYAEYYPEDQAVTVTGPYVPSNEGRFLEPPSDDVEKVGGVTRREDGGNAE